MVALFLFQRDVLNLEPSNVANCVSKGKSEVSELLNLFVEIYLVHHKIQSLSKNIINKYSNARLIFE